MLQVSESCKNPIICENGGAGTGWENVERGKAAKTRPSNAEIVQNLPKRDRQMQRLCKTSQNATIKC